MLGQLFFGLLLIARLALNNYFLTENLFEADIIVTALGILTYMGLSFNLNQIQISNSTISEGIGIMAILTASSLAIFAHYSGFIKGFLIMTNINNIFVFLTTVVIFTIIHYSERHHQKEIQQITKSMLEDK